MKHRDNAFNLPIRVNYQPPTSLLYFISFIHVGGIICLIAVALPVYLKLISVLLLCLNYWRIYSDLVSDTASKSKPVLLLNRENEWSLLDADNNSVAVTLEPAAFVHRLLLVLRLRRKEGKIRAFILTPENVEKNTLRRLRVRLLHDRRKP